MRNIKIFLIGLFISTLLINCDKDKNNSEECSGTIVYNEPSNVKSKVEYYNNDGFLTREEINDFDSNGNYYLTYKYDSENKLVEYFSSTEGYTKYLYEGDKRVKKEFYDSDMVLTGYNTFEYSDNMIIDQKLYTTEGLDTTTKYYFYNGHLDSTVTILPGGVKTLINKTYYKYDSKGNNIELLIYSNRYSENIELFKSYHYSYDDNSNLVKYEFRNKNGDLEFGTYFRYEYNVAGNLAKTKIYDSNDNQIDSLLVNYQYCKEIKLKRPEL
jgi:hypothetical protein